MNQRTQGVGVDVVLDTVGKETLSRSIAVTKPFGRLVTIVGQAGDVTWGVYKNLTIHLVLIQRARSKLDELRALIEQGQIIPVIFRLSGHTESDSVMQKQSGPCTVVTQCVYLW